MEKRKYMKNGSITVFLALILSLVVSLISASIESVRMAASRTQILAGMDIGLFSLFAQYDRTLQKDYDLFLLDGTQDKGELDMAGIYENFSSYMMPVLLQNGHSLWMLDGSITGYRLATDDGGEAFYQQVVQYMEDTLGVQGVELLVNAFKSLTQQTSKAEQKGAEIESSSAMDAYNQEMNNASQKSQEKLAQMEKDNPGSTKDNSSLTSGSEQKVVNPITTIERIRKMGILQLVIPANKGISDKELDKSTVLSKRTVQTGLPMLDSLSKESSYTSKCLFQKYLTDHLGNYLEPASNGLSYQIEYILGKKMSDQENLKAVANKLLTIRIGVNAAALALNPTLRSQAKSLAMLISSLFPIPPLAAVIETALIAAWAYAESILDLRQLFAGGRVPVVKTSQNWQISLQNLHKLLSGLDTYRKNDQSGLSYQDYLHVLLLKESKTELLTGGMDIIEQAVRADGWQNFRLDCCITALEVSVDVMANTTKIYNVTRSYCYD